MGKDQQKEPHPLLMIACPARRQFRQIERICDELVVLQSLHGVAQLVQTLCVFPMLCGDKPDRLDGYYRSLFAKHFSYSEVSHRLVVAVLEHVPRALSE